MLLARRATSKPARPSMRRSRRIRTFSKRRHHYRLGPLGHGRTAWADNCCHCQIYRYQVTFLTVLCSFSEGTMHNRPIQIALKSYQRRDLQHACSVVGDALQYPQRFERACACQPREPTTDMQCAALKRRVKLPTKNKKRFSLKWPMSGKDLPSSAQTFRAEAEPRHQI
jgi:hypothetical protein